MIRLNTPVYTALPTPSLPVAQTPSQNIPKTETLKTAPATVTPQATRFGVDAAQLFNALVTISKAAKPKPKQESNKQTDPKKS